MRGRVRQRITPRGERRDWIRYGHVNHRDAAEGSPRHHPRRDARAGRGVLPGKGLPAEGADGHDEVVGVRSRRRKTRSSVSAQPTPHGPTAPVGSSWDGHVAAAAQLVRGDVGHAEADANAADHHAVPAASRGSLDDHAHVAGRAAESTHRVRDPYPPWHRLDRASSSGACDAVPVGRAGDGWADA